MPANSSCRRLYTQEPVLYHASPSLIPTASAYPLTASSTAPLVDEQIDAALWTMGNTPIRRSRFARLATDGLGARCVLWLRESPKSSFIAAGIYRVSYSTYCKSLQLTTPAHWSEPMAWVLVGSERTPVRGQVFYEWMQRTIAGLTSRYLTERAQCAVWMDRRRNKRTLST